MDVKRLLTLILAIILIFVAITIIAIVAVSAMVKFGAIAFVILVSGAFGIAIFFDQVCGFAAFLQSMIFGDDV